jgi:hypothetical protein
MATHAFDIGPVTLQRVCSNHVRAMARGVPEDIVDWFVACVEGAASATVEKGGGKRAEVHTRAPIRNFGESTVIFEIKWS